MGLQMPEKSSTYTLISSSLSNSKEIAVGGWDLCASLNAGQCIRDRMQQYLQNIYISSETAN